MGTARPLISARYLDLLELHLASRGLDLPRFFDAVGLAAVAGRSQNGGISCAAFAELLDLIAQYTNDEAFSLGYVEALPARPDGVYQTIIFHSRTLRDALCAMCHFSALMTDAFSLRYEEDGACGTVVFDFPSELMLRRQFVAGQIGIIAVRARQLLGESCKPARVDFSFAAPKDLSPFRRSLGPNIRFGASINSVRYSLAALHKPLPCADEVLARQINEYGLELLEEWRLEQTLEKRVARYLRGALQRGEATESQVCLALSIGRRTLQRELLASHTSFRRILEDQRRQSAEHYLYASDLSLTAIAALLGYSELSAFSRACKKWFGNTPSAVRRLQLMKKVERDEPVRATALAPIPAGTRRPV